MLHCNAEKLPCWCAVVPPRCLARITWYSYRVARLLDTSAIRCRPVDNCWPGPISAA